jgi:hypothetical protein
MALFLATTVVTALNSVYFKRLLNCFRGGGADGEPEHDYAVFVSVFDILLWAVLMSAVARAGGWKIDSVRFPRRALLRVAAVDQLGTLLSTLGAPYVPGQVQVVLNQAVLPITMGLTAACGRHHTCAEVAGAGLVLAGASVAAGLSASWARGAEALHAGTLVFLAAQFAVALAGLQKESLLQGGPQLPHGKAQGREAEQPVTDSIALGVVTAWLRVPFGVLLAVGLRLGGGGSVLSEFWDGWLCFWGREPNPGDVGCREAAPTMLLSVVLYAGQTLLGLRLTQCGSATQRSIAAVTAVPLASALFTSRRLMSSPGAESYTGNSAQGLVLCLLGFAVYIQGRCLR